MINETRIHSGSNTKFTELNAKKGSAGVYDHNDAGKREEKMYQMPKI